MADPTPINRGTSSSTSRRRQPSFSKEDMEYDPDEFLVPAQDAKGHNLREVVRVPPGMERDIEEIIQGRRFPYRTRSDLIRHAIYRHLAWLHRLEPEMPQHFFAGLAMLQKLIGDESYKRDMEVSLSKIEESVLFYINRGEMGEACKLIATAKSQMDRVGDSPWKRRWMREFRDKFGRYIDGTGNGQGPKQLAAPETDEAAAEAQEEEQGQGQDEAQEHEGI